MRNELYLPGISFADRDELIDTICARLNKTIGFNARERIKTIAEGHPVSTELLVRNSERINFDKLSTYKQGLDLSNSDHAEEFIKRLIEDVLDEKSYKLLKNLSVLNTGIDSNLDIEAIKNSSPDNFHQIMAELYDTGMLRKRENSENIYRFNYRHVEEVLANDEIERHEWALSYYKNKNIISPEDKIEELRHQSLIKVNKDVIDGFIDLVNKMNPTEKGFSRLIDIGIILIENVSQLKQKATILRKLGYLCGSLNRIDDALKYTEDAKAIYEKFLKRDKNNQNYKNIIAYIWCNLGNAYMASEKYIEAEKAYNKSLFIYGQIPTGKQKKPHYITSIIHMNKGNLYAKIDRFEDALDEYKKSLKISSFFDQNNLEILIDTQHTLIGLFRIYIEIGMIEEGIYNLK
jgi:tetratricopeptide (TPR) repeat protein